MSEVVTGEATEQKGSGVKRLLTFILMGIPAGFLCGFSGSVLAMTIACGSWGWSVGFALLLLASTVLVVHGTRTFKEIVLLVVLLPVPLFILCACFFSEAGGKGPNGLLFFLGAAVPAALYPTSRYFWRRLKSERASVVSATAH
jgi:hypothetical protein